MRRIIITAGITSTPTFPHHWWDRKVSHLRWQSVGASAKRSRAFLRTSGNRKRGSASLNLTPFLAHQCSSPVGPCSPPTVPWTPWWRARATSASRRTASWWEVLPRSDDYRLIDDETPARNTVISSEYRVWITTRLSIDWRRCDAWGTVFEKNKWGT